MVTILDWLLVSMRKLAEAGVDSPRRDCLVLMEDTISKDRAWIISHPEFELKQEQITALNDLIERRAEREPLAYIRGKVWFYKRFFSVNPGVLIPRPESESFINLLKEIYKSSAQFHRFDAMQGETEAHTESYKKYDEGALEVSTKQRANSNIRATGSASRQDDAPMNIVDIGTGSGALAITAKLELPSAEVFASDSGAEALLIARKNAAEHNVNVTFKKGSLLEPWVKKVFSKNAAVLANLPYVPVGMITSPEITKEPRAALFSGRDGLYHYREFWQQITDLKVKPEFVFTESLENQHMYLEGMAEKAGYTLQKTEVLVQQYKLAA